MTANSTRLARSPQALDVIIVNFNTREDLLVCLRSLAAAPADRPQQIVVVDNASIDGSVEAVRREFPAVTLIEMGRNAGFAAANNAGIRATSSPLVVLLNSDTIVPAGALDRLCERLEATGAAAAGPRLLDGAGRPEMSWGRMLTPIVEWQQQRLVRASAAGDAAAAADVRARTSSERVVDWVSGACLLVRRDAAEARARDGRILFTPAAEVTHLRGRATVKLPAQKPSHYDRSHLAFYAKHAPIWVPVLWLWKKLKGRI